MSVKEPDAPFAVAAVARVAVNALDLPFRVRAISASLKQSRLRTLCQGNLASAFRAFILRPVHIITDREFAHEPRIQRNQQMAHLCRIRYTRIEPQVIFLRLNNHRHSVVNVANQNIRLRRQDGAGLHLSVGRRVEPPVPESRESEERIVGQPKMIRLFAPLAGSLPFIETFGGNEAAAAPQRILECRLLRRRFTHRVDRVRSDGGSDGGVPGPPWYESPAQQ